ncbi:MAG: hypothetical protein Q8M22_01675 [Actinomycetota bacterium]|nr:hypothetical protein [Actinomycetota bacterium]
MTSKQLGTARAVGACAAIAVMLLMSPGTASATIDECVRKKVDEGTERAKAMTECLSEAGNTATTIQAVPINAGSDSDDGTSLALLALVGLGGAAVGAIAMKVLRKPDAAASAPPAVGAQPANMPPPGFAAPGVQSAPAFDRSRPLVATLIDLSDRVSSGALRAEIIAALAQAGVQVLEPAQGTAFDANHMRGVGSAPAPDPGWVGKVAATERAGFVDGGTVVRLPEVVVYTAGG